MTLQRFLNGMGDGRWSWALCLARRKPRPDQAMPVLAALIQVLAWGAVGCLVGLLLMPVMASSDWGGGFWPVRVVGSLGLAFGGVGQALVMVAWNRRAAGLRRAGLVEAPALPRRRWWQTWLVAPVYVFLLLVLTPLALWVAVDNALGAAEWRRARARLVARGEPLSVAELIPPRPADEQNFAMTPLLKPINEYDYVISNRLTEIVWRDPAGRHRPEALRLPNPLTLEKPDRTRGVQRTNDGRLDLDSYARGMRAEPVRRFEVELPPELMERYGLARSNTSRMSEKVARTLVIAEPAKEVLDYLRRFEPEMHEIAAAAERPHSQFAVRWEDGAMLLMNNLSHAKAFSTLFRVRASARLAAGDGAGAYADVRTLFRLVDKGAPEPLLISLLVQIAQMAIATSATWEGIVSGRWTEPQLAELQQVVLGIDVQARGVRAFTGERVWGILQMDALVSDPGGLAMLAPGAEGSGSTRGMGGPLRRLFSPVGLLRRNQVAQNRGLDVLLRRLRDPQWALNVGERFDMKGVMAEAGLNPRTPYNTMAALLLPAYDKSAAKLARQAATLRMAGIACALERHRLALGSHPAELQGLVPRFMEEVPLDPLAMKAFHYERLANGRFRLWSVGPNGRDDGGKMFELEKRDQGDWVWPSAEAGTEPRLF